MAGIDNWIAHFGSGGTLGVIIAVLLGLRHATDPDHLTALSTLVLAERRDGRHRDGARRAGLLGLAWGLGHATTLIAFGLPVVLFRQYLPEIVQRMAEAVIGAVIIALSVRLLVRWRRGYFHTHAHFHGAVQHAHPHVHEERHDAAPAPAMHAHGHAEAMGRTPLASFGIGLMHGVGGSAGAGILLVSAMPGRGSAVLALALFAAATALSMAVLSTAFGYALVRGPVARRLAPLVPVLGVASLVFGVWYAMNALWGGSPAT